MERKKKKEIMEMMVWEEIEEKMIE